MKYEAILFELDEEYMENGGKGRNATIGPSLLNRFERLIDFRRSIICTIIKPEVSVRDYFSDYKSCRIRFF